MTQETEHQRATADDHARLDSISRWFRRRWVMPAVAVFLVGWAAYNSNAATANTSKLTQVQADIAVIAAVDQQLQAFDANQTKVNEQQSVIFNDFLENFVAEANYECTIASLRAAASGLPTPAPGVCDVKFPSG